MITTPSRDHQPTNRLPPARAAGTDTVAAVRLRRRLPGPVRAPPLVVAAKREAKMLHGNFNFRSGTPVSCGRLMKRWSLWPQEVGGGASRNEPAPRAGWSVCVEVGEQLRAALSSSEQFSSLHAAPERALWRPRHQLQVVIDS